MSDTDDKWPLPDYNPGPPKHLHAIGVISMNYNAYERAIYSLYTFHLYRKDVPAQIIEHYFFNLSERLQLDAIRQVFLGYERSKKVLAVLESNLKYFDWCWHVRNSVLHSYRHQSLIGDPEGSDSIQLVKRRGKKSAAMGYKRFTLKDLRQFADQIREGQIHCLLLYIHLRQRGRPQSKWTDPLRRHGPQPLPGILVTPEYLTLEDHPSDPIPRPQREPSGE